MKRLIIFMITSATLLAAMNGCGPSEEEQRRQEQARQDSLEQVRQQRIEQQRQDSIEQARQDSLEAARQAEEERRRIEFDESGRFAVQVESWRSEDMAEEQVSKWQDRGYENAHVVKHGDEDRGDVWFRVRLGRFASKDMAQKFQALLEEDYETQSWISYADQGQQAQNQSSN